MRASTSPAVKAAVGPWSNRIATTVAVRDQSSRGEENGVYDLVTVTVTAHVRCAVPVGKVICGLAGTQEIIDIKSMPHQGARYKTRECAGGRSAEGGRGGGSGGRRDGDRGTRAGETSDADGTFRGGGGGFGGGGATGRWP